MKNILLLTCGTSACCHIARVLKEKFADSVRIIGADINKRWLIPSAPYLDVFYQCPFSTDISYYSFIIKICRSEKVDYVLPSFDVDQRLFYAGNPDLLAMGVISFGISAPMLDIYSDKDRMNRYLRTVGLPLPIQYDLSQVEHDKMYFVKPLDGVGSVGASIVSGREVLLKNDRSLIIQEVCFYPEVTLECFYYDDSLRSVARQRIDTKAGVCTKTKIYNDPQLHAIAERFVAETSAPMVFNLQFMKNREGKYVITDVNLRAAGGMSMSYAAGWDEVSSLANVMLGKGKEDVLKSVPMLIQEQYIMRTYSDVVTKYVKQRIALDLDGTLLDSRLRHSVLMHDILLSKGLSIDTADLVDYKSNGKSNLDWLIDKHISNDEANAIQKEWISKIEDEKYLQLDKLYPDALKILERLSYDNSLFLLTARMNKEGAMEQIMRLGISPFFEEIIVVPTGDDAIDFKARMLTDKGINLMIGDSEIDYKASKRAKCKFQAKVGGFRSKSFWEQYQVDFFE